MKRASDVPIFVGVREARKAVDVKEEIRKMQEKREKTKVMAEKWKKGGVK